MFVSLGQGGNQLAACLWQRATAGEMQDATETTTSGRNRSSVRRPEGAASASAAAHAAAASASSALPAPSSSSASGGLGLPLGLSVPRSPWFALDGFARAVCIDAEPKVVQQMQRMGSALAMAAAGAGDTAAAPPKAKGAAASPPARNLFRPSNLRVEQHGRGNNWAMGYYGRLALEGAAGSLLSDSLECIRRESERLDVFDSLVLLHSLAGGTGSGLGSRLAEEVRAAFPKVFLLSVSIAPFGVGDTPLQHYNQLLALAHLYPTVDGLLLASNADVARAMQSATAARSGALGGTVASAAAPEMAFDGLNTYLAAALADVLAPTRLVPSASSAAFASPLQATAPLYELLSHVAPLPAFKLLEIWSSAGLGSSVGAAAHMSDPRAPPLPSWKACADVLARFVPEGGVGRALAYTCFARGDSTAEPLLSSRAEFELVTARMAKMFPPVSWNPHVLDLVPTQLPRLVQRAPARRNGLSAARAGGGPVEAARSLSVCVNRSRTALSLRPSLRRARVLLSQRAYTHWYTRYGVELDEIAQALDDVDSVVQDYASA